MISSSPIPDTPLANNPTKRKRSFSDSTITPFAPRLQSDEAVDSTSYEDDRLLGARSPRSVVAERLSDLRLNGPLSVIHFNGLVGPTIPDDERGGKRTKVMRGDSVFEEEDEEDDTVVTQSQHVPHNGFTTIESPRPSKPQPRQRRLMSPPPGGTSSFPEIQDTPPQPASPSTAAPPPHYPRALSDLPRTDILASMNTDHTTKPPTQGPPSNSVAVIIHPSKSAHLKKKRAAETTDNDAHSSDALDPDDDGTGINGIGFRPTPAEAYARQQRRRKQLLDYKARENKEARQRRSQLRGVRGSTPTSSSDGVGMDGLVTGKRQVRFAS